MGGNEKLHLGMVRYPGNICSFFYQDDNERDWQSVFKSAGQYFLTHPARFMHRAAPVPLSHHL
jgi:hypothetical protein